MMTQTHVYLRMTPGDWSRDNDLRPMRPDDWARYRNQMLCKAGFDMTRRFDVRVGVPGYDILYSQERRA